RPEAGDGDPAADARSARSSRRRAARRHPGEGGAAGYGLRRGGADREGFPRYRRVLRLREGVRRQGARRVAGVPPRGLPRRLRGADALRGRTPQLGLHRGDLQEEGYAATSLERQIQVHRFLARGGLAEACDEKPRFIQGSAVVLERIHPPTERDLQAVPLEMLFEAAPPKVGIVDHEGGVRLVRFERAGIVERMRDADAELA